MSGGSYNYIQYKDAKEFIENPSLTQELDHVAARLADFGEIATHAIKDTQTVAERTREIRDQITALHDELNNMIDPLHDVWRQIDYRDSMDVGDDDVVRVLNLYNSAVK